MNSVVPLPLINSTEPPVVLLLSPALKRTLPLDAALFPTSILMLPDNLDVPVEKIRLPESSFDLPEDTIPLPVLSGPATTPV